MHKLNVCVLGGTGFVGHYICSYLSRLGHNVTVITRRRERQRDLLVLPTLKIVEGDVHELGFLRTHFQRIDVVINLIGILNETRRIHQKFEFVHNELTHKVLFACKQTGVTRLLHMSALNADPKGLSAYLRTKGEAEKFAHKSASDSLRVTSFRPSVIFGDGDSFTNRFADMLEQIPLMLPLACPNAVFQPVYVEDVAEVFCRSIGDHHTYGKRYNLCGPERYTLAEIVEFISSVIHSHRKIVKLGDSASRMLARIMEGVPGKPFTRDNYQSMQKDCVCRNPFPKIFNIEPTPMSQVLPGYLALKPDHFSTYRKIAGRNIRTITERN